MPYPYIGPGSTNSPYYYGGGGYKPQTPPRVAPSIQYGSPQPGRYDTPGPIQPAYGAPQPGGGGNPNQNTNQNNQSTTKPPLAPPDFSQLTYANDPLFQAAFKGGETDLGIARARLLEQQKRLLAAYGSRQMAQKLLGDDPFVNTVSDDPYTSMSLLGQSRNKELQDVAAATTRNNKRNLFFSTGQLGDVAELARQRMARDFEGGTKLEEGLSTLGGQYDTLAVQVRAAQRQSEKDAYDRAVAQAILNWQAGYANTGGTPGATAGMDPTQINAANLYSTPGADASPQAQTVGTPAQRYRESLLFGGY